jgi:hypothetical protein
MDAKLSLIVGVVAAVIALISAQVAAVMTHWLTNKRDDRKLTIERQTQRREVLRTKLENLVDLLSSHLIELQARSDLPIPLAATLVVGSAMPWKYNEDSLTGDSMVRAQTLVVLYFPQLLPEVLVLTRRAAAFRDFVGKELKVMRDDPQKWLNTAALTYPDRCEGAHSEYKDEMLAIQLKAQQLMTSML